MAEKFERGVKFKYSMDEKEKLGALVLKYKKEFDDTRKAYPSTTHYDPKTKKHIVRTPSSGFISKAVRSFYIDLKDAKHNSPECGVGAEDINIINCNLFDIFLLSDTLS